MLRETKFNVGSTSRREMYNVVHFNEFVNCTRKMKDQQNHKYFSNFKYSVFLIKFISHKFANSANSLSSFLAMETMR